MSYNIGDFMFSIIKTLTQFTSKLYEVINYQVSIKWLKTALSIINISLDSPDYISLFGIIGTLSAGAIVIIIIYNIFK